MIATKRALGCLIFCLFITGCAARSRVIKEVDLGPEAPKPVVKKEAIKERKVEKDMAVASAPTPSPAPSVEKPQSFQPAIPEQPAAPEKITYNQITNLIGEFLDIKPADNASGKPRFVGISENKLVTLEMIGDKDNISITSIKLVYPDDIEPVNADLNNAMMLRFLKNVAPEIKDWSSNIKDIVNRFHSLQLGDKKEETVSLGGKDIKIVSDKSSNSITVIARYQ